MLIYLAFTLLTILAYLTKNGKIHVCRLSVKEIKKLPEVKCYRIDLFSSLVKALADASLNNKTVFDSMIDRRNAVRRNGRKVFGKCIGTTLLTKGLEFDTVLIINAHKFKCPKNFYVALTRASKRLIIFSESERLNPYS